MASYQIIQPGEGFGSGFGQGLSKGVGDISNIYSKALIGRKFQQLEDTDKEAKQQSNYNKYLAMAKQSGRPINYKFTDNGPSFETDTPEDLKPQDATMGLLGLANDTKTKMMADRLGAKPNDVAMVDPNAAMSLVDGGVGDTGGNQITPNMGDTRKYVSAMFSGNPYLKPNQEVEKMNQKQDAQALPEAFADDFKQAYDGSTNDSNKFIKNLKSLAVKYSTSPAALAFIGKQINIQQEKSDDGNSAFNF
jgi:hypothetical protein